MAEMLRSLIFRALQVHHLNELLRLRRCRVTRQKLPPQLATRSER